MIFHKSTIILAVFVAGFFLLEVDCEDIGSSDTLAVTYLGNVGRKQFFLVDGLRTYQDSWVACQENGMNMVRINNQAEYDFVGYQLVEADKGPFWLGARDLGRRSMYRWEEYPWSLPDLEDPDKLIGDFIYFYYYVEHGPMALQMSKGVGSAVYGSHSFTASAKALCQVG